MVEDQIRNEVLKTIPYGFYATGVIGADGEAQCKDRAVVKQCHRELAEIYTNHCKQRK